MTDQLADRLRALIDAERERFGVPGCAVAVINEGEVVIAEGFGQRDLGRGLPTTTATLFPIGSSTKTFTAALCAALVQDGVLDWDRPVREYLPGFRMYDEAATQGLTVRDMLSHRSGLPRHDLFWYAAPPSVTRDDVVTALRHLEPSKGLRELWQYNNLLYTTAGHLAGKLCGGSYEEAVRSRLLDPLGMSRTNFSVSDAQQDSDCSRPYYVAPDGGEPKEIPFASLDLVGPAGNINSCIDELVPWALTVLGHGVGGRPALLSPEILRELRSSVAAMPEDSPLSIGRSVGYGLGLLIEDYRGRRVTHHGGNIDGFSSQVSTLPDLDAAVVVLTNRDQSGLRDALPYLVYDILLDLPLLPHGETTLQKEQAVRQGMAAAEEQRSGSGRADLGAVRPFEEYAGRYRHPGYGEFTVTLTDDGALRGEYGTVAGSLDHRHLEVFSLILDLGGTERRLPVQFTSDFDGDIDGARAPLEASVRPIVFTRVADRSHLTDDVLDAIAGRYELGPLSGDVLRRGADELVIAIAGMAPKVLQLVHGLVFKVESQRIEFTGDGRLLTPFGEFRKT